MALRNSADSWGWPARLLHWAMALLIIGMLAFGFYLTNAFYPGDFSKFGLVQTHKSFGFVVFALAVVRLVWRLVNPTPSLPVQMGAVERFAAHAGHWLLYLLMAIMPLSGWLASSASLMNDPDAYPMQVRNMVFGLFAMPDPIHPGSEALEDLFMAVHEWAAIALAILLIGHIGAALKHRFVNRDGVLSRMLRG